jgi:hypothetical protein
MIIPHLYGTNIKNTADLWFKLSGVAGNPSGQTAGFCGKAALFAGILLSVGAQLVAVNIFAFASQMVALF